MHACVRTGRQSCARLSDPAVVSLMQERPALSRTTHRIARLSACRRRARRRMMPVDRPLRFDQDIQRPPRLRHELRAARDLTAIAAGGKEDVRARNKVPCETRKIEAVHRAGELDVDEQERDRLPVVPPAPRHSTMHRMPDRCGIRDDHMQIRHTPVGPSLREAGGGLRFYSHDRPQSQAKKCPRRNADMRARRGGHALPTARRHGRDAFTFCRAWRRHPARCCGLPAGRS